MLRYYPSLSDEEKPNLKKVYAEKKIKSLGLLV